MKTFIGSINIKTSVKQFINMITRLSNEKIKRDDLNIIITSIYDERKTPPIKIWTIHIRKSGEEFAVSNFSHVNTEYNANIVLLTSGEGDYAEIYLNPIESTITPINKTLLDTMCNANLLVEINYNGSKDISIDDAIRAVDNVFELISIYCKITKINLELEE